MSNTMPNNNTLPNKPPRHGTAANRWPAITYGVVCYLTFLISFTYAIGFVTGIGVPRTVDNGIAAPLGRAILVNVLLLAAFAIQHSVMARPAFKRWWTRLIPESIERSTYVLLASLLLGLLCWQWRTIGGTVWDVEWAPLRAVIWMLAALGWVTVLASTFMINHFELFGLKQVFEVWRAKPEADTGFRTTMLYRIVRHPLMLGFLLAFWAAPTMTVGHLLFSLGTTAYILIAIRIEEHDLVSTFGDTYRKYRHDVPMLLPHPAHRG
jgi:methanethiol S-methyltransferase